MGVPIATEEQDGGQGERRAREAMLAQDLCSPALQKSHRASGRGLREVTCRKEAFNFNGNSNDDSLCK